MTGFIPRPKKAHDTRFSLVRNFGVPSLDIPDSFSVKTAKGDINGPREQLRNFCTACTTSEIGADEHGIKMSQKFQALAISLIIKKPLYLEGAPIDAAMKSGRVYGFLPLDKEPENIRNSEDPAYICDPQNWPSSVFNEALKYVIPGGDFVVDGPHDHFDNYRAALYNHKPDNGISIGVPWYSSIENAPNGKVKRLTGSFSWHDVYFEGYAKDEAKLRSWNPHSGDDTYFYVPRPLFNQLISTMGAIGKIYKNADEDFVFDLKEKNLSIYEQLMNLWYKALFALYQLFTVKKQLIPEDNSVFTPPPAPVLPVEEPKVPEPKYKWDTPKNARHSVRVIGDEEGLTWKEKDLICAVIQGESGFKNTAKLENKRNGKTWSTDWGICQINDWYHIGRGKTFPSVEYVLQNPDKVVRWMIKCYKQGNLKWWVAYSSGAYLKYMPK